jgi:Flp pilus assembly protein TadG
MRALRYCMTAGLRRFATECRGAVAIEFAAAAPILLLIVSAAVDLGMALHQSSVLGSAARAGAQYALRFPTDAAGIKDVVEKSVGYDPASLTVESKLACECADKTAIACTESCSGTAPQAYISVSVSKPYSSPLPTATMLGITAVYGSSVMRSN